ncbi:MAG: hypothetical protein M3Q40_08385, partial [Pseudomonadota bacterium]|nr:hypothetical protein [Pseudomonadota bacterium]
MLELMTCMIAVSWEERSGGDERAGPVLQGVGRVALAAAEINNGDGLSSFNFYFNEFCASPDLSALAPDPVVPSSLGSAS